MLPSATAEGSKTALYINITLLPLEEIIYCHLASVETLPFQLEGS
jgi:hypothetical protein